MNKKHPCRHYFRIEREMHEYARGWLNGLGLMVKEEFYTPWGVCDFVAVSLAADRVEQRLSLGQRQALGPPLRIQLFNRIPDSATGKTISAKRLGREFNHILEPAELARELDRLEEARFVSRTKRGNLQKLNGWVPLHERIVALELKLSRVEEALNQARAHLCFADESYVGFPVDRAERLLCSKRIRRFEENGVGVVGIARGQCFVVLPSRPIHGQKDALMQMHCSERFWRTMVKDNSP